MLFDPHLRTVGKLLIAFLCSSALTLAQDTVKVSVSTSGDGGNSTSSDPSLSEDARWIAYSSFATNLVPSDTNGEEDVFVHDSDFASTARVSIASDGSQGNGRSYQAAISADGRFVAFTSLANNLVSVDSNVHSDVFVHDLQTGVAELVSVSLSGQSGNNRSFGPAISGDGRFVAFVSSASNLVAGDLNNVADVFVRDRQSGVTERVSVATSGSEANLGSLDVDISRDGRFVAFSSSASNLAPDDSFLGPVDVFVRDRQSATTELISRSSAGLIGNGDSLEAAISDDGRFVAFRSHASDLFPGDSNGWQDIFVRDRQLNTTVRANVGGLGEANERSEAPDISGDGRYIAFWSRASNLVGDDTNDQIDSFVHDCVSGTMRRVSVSSTGGQASGGSLAPAISQDGQFVAFHSWANDLVPNDPVAQDVFLHGCGIGSLQITVDPTQPVAGQLVTFSVITGPPDAPALLVATDIRGLETFLPIALEFFDPAGEWSVSGLIPPGLQGVSVTFGLATVAGLVSCPDLKIVFQ